MTECVLLALVMAVSYVLGIRYGLNHRDREHRGVSLARGGGSPGEARGPSPAPPPFVEKPDGPVSTVTVEHADGSAPVYLRADADHNARARELRSENKRRSDRHRAGMTVD